MSTAVVAESTGTLIEAVATQDCLADADGNGRAVRYGVVFGAYEAGGSGFEGVAAQLYMSEADAAEAAKSFKFPRIVRVTVEVERV